MLHAYLKNSHLILSKGSMNSNILNPYVKGLTDSAALSMHLDADITGTPSVEPDVGMFLEHFVYSSKPKKVLELGCGIGVSTRYIAKGAPDAHITALDTNLKRLSFARENCKGLNVDFKAEDAVKYVSTSNEKFDMIFVDSMKKQYPMLFHYLYKMLNDGGTIIFDDMFVYGEVFCQDCEIAPKYLPLVKTLREFMENIKNSYRHSFLPLGGGLMLVGK